MALTVLQPGIESRIVDLGRPRTRSLGVPVGGAADRRSLALGNSLIGNPPDAPALEIALKGPSLRADAWTACVLFGAPFEAAFTQPWWDEPVFGNGTFVMPANEVLEIGGTASGARAYLCVRGGFDLPAILGSRSALEPIKKGDILSCATSVIHRRFCPEAQGVFPAIPTISVLPGLQSDWFDDAKFYDQTFTVTPASNRMGMRLHGKALTMPDREIVSEPVCPGAIQVTRDGQCIVLGVDGQTIGGYPKIAQVIQADLDALGQLRPGQSIRFVKTTMPDAIRLARAAQAELRHWSMRLRLSLDAFPGERRQSGSSNPDTSFSAGSTPGGR